MSKNNPIARSDVNMHSGWGRRRMWSRGAQTPRLCWGSCSCRWFHTAPQQRRLRGQRQPWRALRVERQKRTKRKVISMIVACISSDHGISFFHFLLPGFNICDLEHQSRAKDAEEPHKWKEMRTFVMVMCEYGRKQRRKRTHNRQLDRCVRHWLFSFSPGREQLHSRDCFAAFGICGNFSYDPILHTCWFGGSISII